MLVSTRLDSVRDAAGRGTQGAVGDRSGSAGGRVLSVEVAPDPELVERPLGLAASRATGGGTRGRAGYGPTALAPMWAAWKRRRPAWAQARPGIPRSPLRRRQVAVVGEVRPRHDGAPPPARSRRGSPRASPRSDSFPSRPAGSARVPRLLTKGTRPSCRRSLWPAVKGSSRLTGPSALSRASSVAKPSRLWLLQTSRRRQ